jgi:hypothetical protein
MLAHDLVRKRFPSPPSRGHAFRGHARLDLTIETRDAAHAEEYCAVLSADGYRPVRVEPGAVME